MFCYEEIKAHPELLLAMTSLTESEFDQLLIHFQKAYDEYRKRCFTDRPDRKRDYGGVSESTLVNIDDKLLFILYYMKAYPLQEIIAYEFGMTQSTANDWIHILSGVMKDALAYAGHVPERNPKVLEDIISNKDYEEYIIDATERRIQRPKDNQEQKDHYSGKKKPIQSKISSLVELMNKRSLI